VSRKIDMKVKDLIKELEKLPPEDEIFILDDGCCSDNEISDPQVSRLYYKGDHGYRTDYGYDHYQEGWTL
jgi:hypothetical protein